MAIVQGTTTAAKQAALAYLATGTVKMALYTSAADLGPDTAAYGTGGEVVGGGYTAGGTVLTNVTVSTANGVAYLSFDPATWSPASFTARAALIYNPTHNGAAVAVLDFGADKTAVNTFTVQLPPNTASSAIIRFS